MASEKKSLEDIDENLLEDAELEEVAGGHLVIRGKTGKAFKLFCPHCQSAHVRFANKMRDMNGRPGGEGNYEWEMRKVVQQMVGGYEVECLDCGKKFRTSDAKWSDDITWNPNDYSD